MCGDVATLDVCRDRGAVLPPGSSAGTGRRLCLRGGLLGRSLLGRAGLGCGSGRSLLDVALDRLPENLPAHTYPKPYIAFMDGICMGGGMGISQGASLRIVTERSKIAMPETGIGLFPDVGGGYFLSRCPGRMGEYLALTGLVLDGAHALTAGLADALMDSVRLAGLWDSLGQTPYESGEAVERWCRNHVQKVPPKAQFPQVDIDRVFALDSVKAIVQALEQAEGEWARATAQLLRKRSPLMLHVVLEQVRRARGMGLADELRMERDLVRRCFHLRPGAASETVEGIRALAVDKDHMPRWNPSRIEEVDDALVAEFCVSPLPALSHPLDPLG